MVILFGLQTSLLAQNDFTLERYTTSDNGTIQAAYFDAGTKKVVVFAHGAVFNKESWYFLAEKLKAKGISSLSIDFRGYGNSKAGNSNQLHLDIIGAIDYLVKQGTAEIFIVGGSMGGAAVLRALDEIKQPSIKKVVLLAPAGGPAIKSEGINKFFIVSQKEGLYQSVLDTFTKSADPKTLKTYEGNAHAQHLFKSQHGDNVTSLIIDFLER